MRVPRLYVDMPLVTGEVVELPVRHSNYLCKVLRMEAARELWLFNSTGGAFKSCIALANPKKARVLVGEHDEANRESPLEIELGVALSKGDRFDFVVQKATELGVTSIRPLITERIDVRLNAERTGKKLDHWKGISISACEQSGRNILPEVCEPVSLSQWCSSIDQDCRVMMDSRAKSSIRDLNLAETNKRVAVLIGSEGGFSESEAQLTSASNFVGVALGPRILRTETAPMAIISIMQSLWGDF